MIHVVLYYETVCSLVPSFTRIVSHAATCFHRLLPSYSYSSRADTFLKVSGTLYRFGSKLGVRGRVSLFNFSILLRFNPPNSRVIRDYFWIYLEHLLVLYIREWYTLIEAIGINKRI